MRIKLPNYTIQNTTEKPQSTSFFSLLFLFVFGLFCGYILLKTLGNNNADILQTRNIVLEEQSSIHLDKIAELEAEISLLKTDQKVRKQASVTLQKDYKKLLNNNSALAADIKFYEKLLSSSSSKKDVRIFDAKIQKIQTNTYKIKFSITQKIEKARETTGKYRVSIIGKEKDKQKTIKITESDTNYKFKYFQNVSLDFLLPNGFIAQQLVVELFPNNKKAKPIKHMVEWLVQ